MAPNMFYLDKCFRIICILLLYGMFYKCQVGQADQWCCSGHLYLFWFSASLIYQLVAEWYWSLQYHYNWISLFVFLISIRFCITYSDTLFLVTYLFNIVVSSWRTDSFLKKYFIYLFIYFRERGREGEREGEKHQCVVASHTSPHWGLSPQPRRVPWPGIELVTFWFMEQHPTHWPCQSEPRKYILMFVNITGEVKN